MFNSGTSNNVLDLSGNNGSGGALERGDWVLLDLSDATDVGTEFISPAAATPAVVQYIAGVVLGTDDKDSFADGEPIKVRVFGYCPVVAVHNSAGAISAGSGLILAGGATDDYAVVSAALGSLTDGDKLVAVAHEAYNTGSKGTIAAFVNSLFAGSSLV